MKMITPAQLKFIHVLLAELGIMKYKAELVSGFTGQRTESCREMTLQEAKELIEHLKGSKEHSEIIRRIWHLAYEMEMIIKGDKNEMSMNAAKLDEFCKQRGSVKKPLKEQTLPELKRTAKQFAAMCEKYQVKQVKREYMERLKEKLSLLIEKEEYEQAAFIKRQIDQLNEEIKPKRKKPLSTA